MTIAKWIHRIAGAVSAATLLTACPAPEIPAPSTALPALPEGAVIAGDAEALRRFLLGAELLRGTPLARGAGVLRGRLAPCKEFSASWATSDSAKTNRSGELGEPVPSIALAEGIETASCDRSPLDNPALQALRGDAEIVFLLPLGDGGRVAGRARIDDVGSLRIEAELLELPFGKAARLVIPDSGPVGPRRLSEEGTLASARFRPDGGLDLATLVPSGSQADQMFRLKSAIFRGTALSGAWEFALYAPSADRAMPLLALSADVRLRSAALAGMREFIADLESTWPLHHRAVVFGERGEHPGACFFELRILPEFAPCYADTPEAIVIGWNPEAIQRALFRPVGDGTQQATTSAAGPEDEHAAELIVRLADLSLVDDRLRRAFGGDVAPAQAVYFWDRFAAVAGRSDPALGAGLPESSGVWLRAELRAADGRTPETTGEVRVGHAAEVTAGGPS